MIRVHHLSARATTEQCMEAMLGFEPVAHGTVCATLWALGLYDHVANVAGDDKGVAFRQTNNIDHYWGDNSGLRALATAERAPDEHRSTSVGDVMVMEDGTVHVVAATGFTDVTPYLKSTAIV